MGSLAAHLSVFLFLFPIAIRRLLCSFSLFLKSPHLFRAKTWYLAEPKWKNIDLYFLLIVLPIAAFSEAFWFLTFSGYPTHRFAFFQQSAVISLFWVFIISITIREVFDVNVINESLLFIFAGTAFLMEYSVMGEGTTGLAGRMYELLGFLSIICAASYILLSFKPMAFFTEVVLSSSLVFKSTWTLQVGLSLYSDSFVPKGCHKMPVSPAYANSDLQCELEEDRWRGMALVDLLFVLHAIGILVASFVLFGLLASSRNLRCGEGSVPSLADIDSEVMHSVPEFEIE